jgi:CubicO group peptidase (beta-lactamase class C family)
MLLGYIIEDVSKMPYEKAVRRYIFGPAGMTHSGFDFTHLIDPNKAVGYFRIGADSSTTAPIVDSSVSFAAGAIYSTTGDLYKWFQSWQADRVIKKTSKEQALSPVMNQYGYGWHIDSIFGKRRIGHGGGIHGFNTNMASIPEDNATIILLNNAGNPFLDRITESIFAILYDKPYQFPEERTSAAMAADSLKQYTGVYDLSEQLIITVRMEDGKLLGKPEGQEELQLHPQKETDTFYVEEVEADVVFNRNAAHEIISMTLKQRGREMTGKKR